jgi:hypothetical protein
MIVADYLPFIFVQSPFFAAVLRMARPNVLIPGRQKIRCLLDKWYEKLQTALFANLGPHTKVLLALDCWSSPNKLSFLGILAYYISIDWKYWEVLISFEQVIGSHTEENLAHIVKSVVLRYNFWPCLFAITADNASNSGTLRQSLQVPLCGYNIYLDANAMRINCLAHVLHLSAKTLLDSLKVITEERAGSFMDSATIGETLPGQRGVTKVFKTIDQVLFLLFILCLFHS